MLTGRRAFRGETKVSTIAAILNRDPEPLAETTPRELDRILQRCLRKDPARRFQTMADLKVALEELKDEFDSARLAGPIGPVAGKRSWLLVAAAVAISALLLGAAWWTWGARPAPRSGSGNLRQLTYDDRVSGRPSLSNDAKFVVYHSDRTGPGRFDIHTQQTAGGPPFNITEGQGNNFRSSILRRRIAHLFQLARAAARNLRNIDAGRRTAVGCPRRFSASHLS